MAASARMKDLLSRCLRPVATGKKGGRSRQATSAQLSTAPERGSKRCVQQGAYGTFRLNLFGVNGRSVRAAAKIAAEPLPFESQHPRKPVRRTYADEKGYYGLTFSRSLTKLSVPAIAGTRPTAMRDPLAERRQLRRMSSRPSSASFLLQASSRLACPRAFRFGGYQWPSSTSGRENGSEAVQPVPLPSRCVRPCPSGLNIRVVLS